MIIKCECNKTEYSELIEQLKDEGIHYCATVQTTFDQFIDDEKEEYVCTQYYVVFNYSGKLI